MLRSSLIPTEMQFMVSPSEGAEDRAGDYQYFSPTVQLPRQDSQSGGSPQSKQKCEAGVGKEGPTKKMVETLQATYFSDCQQSQDLLTRSRGLLFDSHCMLVAIEREAKIAIKLQSI